MKLAGDFQTISSDNQRAGRRTVLLFSLLVALMLSATGYVNSAEAEVPSIVSLDDINGNGSPEVSVLLRTIDGKNYVYVMDGSDGAQIKKLEFDATLTPLFQAAVPDMDGSAVDEVAMLGVGPDGYLKLLIKDAETGALINTLSFDKNFPPVAMTALPDIDGNGFPEIAVLGVRASDGKVKVSVKDANSGDLIKGILFDKDFPPIAMVVVPDMDGNGISELAVLGVRVSDGKVQVTIKDASTGDKTGSATSFDKNFPPVALAVVPDIDGNGISEIAVLGVRVSDGKIKAAIKDASSGALVKGIFFDKKFPPLAVEVVPDIDGNGFPEIALLGVGTNEGYVKVFMKDAETGALVNTLSFDRNYPPVGMTVMPDIDGGGISEIAVLGVNMGSGRGKVSIKDASTEAVITKFFLSSYFVLPSDSTIRVSVAPDGTQGNGGSYGSSISSDGRYVAFGSSSTNLVAGDTNGAYNIFVYDTQTGVTTRVSVASDGTQGNSNSYSPSISSDGRYVAFRSWATNLVAGDTNGEIDVFLHDTQTGVTTLVSVASDGTQSNRISYDPSISGNGRHVTFASSADNLVAGDTNNTYDIFLHDTQTGVTTRVSVDSDGTQGNNGSGSPSISSDGRYVAFFSLADNLVAGDTNGYYDVFVHDTQTGATTRVSVASDGTEGNYHSYIPSISGDGRYVAFHSSADNLVAGDTNGYDDVFLHDTQTGTTTRISVASDGTQGNAYSYYPSLSSDGRYVAFKSYAYNLVAGDTNGDWDVFVHDTQTSVTTRVSVAYDGTQGNSQSYATSISSDGRYVAFFSLADNLVPSDTNGEGDVFRVVNPLYAAP